MFSSPKAHDRKRDWRRWVLGLAAVGGIVVVGATGVGTTIGKRTEVASRKAATATTEEVVEQPPVQVLVRRDIEPGQVRYNYRVINGSAFLITSLVIGYDYVRGAPELPIGPVGLSDAGLPDSSTTSPSNWSFSIVEAEEDSLVQFEWKADTTADAIAGGAALGGFSVVLPQESAMNEAGHWTVYLNSTEEVHYSWALEVEGMSWVPPSSVNAHTGVRLSPNPMRSTVRIDFEMPTTGVVSVWVFDAEGRAVKELVRQKLDAGPRSAVWDGRDAAGQLMPAGTYFVRIKTPTTQRFARIARVK